MGGNSTFVNIILIVIVLHLVVGFVFLATKLSGKPIEEDDENTEKDDN